MNLAIGFFDGIHLGHRRVLEAADAVLTFREHPLSVLRPEAAPVLLMSAEDRLAALAEGGRRKVVALDFTPALAAEEPEAFVERLKGLFPEIDRALCGANWRFGRGGRGDAAFLTAAGVPCETVPYAVRDGAPVSSTRIREALAAGDAGAAATMLGRPYAVSGTVRKGKGVGRTIGFPTLNVDPGRPLPLRRGVWAVDTPFGSAAANWGCAPTAGDAAWMEPVLEAHLLEPPQGALPVAGERLNMTVRGFIRDERVFPDFAALSTRIAEDIRVCLAMR